MLLGAMRNLLSVWRDATTAAELAESLARRARRAVEEADADWAEAEEIATLAEEVAASAERAARVAREGALRAATNAARHGHDLTKADERAAQARTTESGARDRYQQAEDDARGHSPRQDG